MISPTLHTQRNTATNDIFILAAKVSGRVSIQLTVAYSIPLKYVVTIKAGQAFGQFRLLVQVMRFEYFERMNFRGRVVN